MFCAKLVSVWERTPRPFAPNARTSNSIAITNGFTKGCARAPHVCSSADHELHCPMVVEAALALQALSCHGRWNFDNKLGLHSFLSTPFLRAELRMR